MFVNRRLDNSDPLAKISPEILQKIETVQTTIGVATSDNIADTIVKRDAAGDFSAGKIKLSNVESSGSVLSIAGDNTTNTLNIGSGTGVQSVNIGNNGTGATTIQVGGSGDTVNVGTSLSRAGAVTMYPESMNLNSSVTSNVATLADLNLGMVYNGGSPASNFVSASGRILMNATAHNTSQGRKAIPAGIQTRVLQNGTTPSKSVLSFLGSSTVFGSTISECGSIDADGVFKCSSVESTGTTLIIAGQDTTSVLNLGSGTGVQTINVGNNGAGATTINLGGGSDIVKLNFPLKDSAGANILSSGPNNNTQVGKNAMMALTTGSANVAIGTSIAFSATTAVGNVYIGHQSGLNAGPNVNFNTGVGYNSIQNATADQNTGLGWKSLLTLTSGSGNVGIGVSAGETLLTGGSNTFLGTSANCTSASTSISNSTAIGAGAIVDANNTIQLGNPSVTQVKTSGTISAAGLESIGTTLTIAGQNNTSVLNIGSGTGVQTINMGNNGAGATTINIGGGTDNVNFTGAGIRLPTIGGTPSVLDYYEEYDFTTNWVGRDNPLGIPMSLVRIGRMVTLFMKRLATFTMTSEQITSGGLKSTVLLPERFFTNSGTAYHHLIQPIPMYHNGAMKFGTLNIEPHYDYYLKVRGFGFDIAAGDTGSIERFTVSWTL